MADCIVQYRDVMTAGKKQWPQQSQPGWIFDQDCWRSRPEISGVHFVKPAWLAQPWSHMGLLSITIECAGQTHQIQDITPPLSPLFPRYDDISSELAGDNWILSEDQQGGQVNQMDIRSSAQFSSHKKQWSSCIFRSGYNCEEGGGRRGGLLTPYIIASLPDLISHNFNV